jgi:hypothetical protein
MYIIMLKIPSVGCDIKFYSMAILFLIFHVHQQSNALAIQTILRVLPDNLWVIVVRSPTPGFQEQLSSTLTHAHMNLAKEQWKIIWFVSSISPQSTHSPVDGSCLFQIWSLEDSLPLTSCQRKILIFVGIFECHTSLSVLLFHPPHSLWYMDLIEKQLNASNTEVTTSLSSLRWNNSILWERSDALPQFEPPMLLAAQFFLQWFLLEKRCTFLVFKVA